jgi:mannose-6-phosphate isomerase
MEKALYPLKFAPCYRPAATGSTLLAETLARGLPPDQVIGESYELIDRGETQSVVANGPLAGQTLAQLVATGPAALVGNRFHTVQPFPLLLRYVVSGRRLPVWIHPDDLASGTVTPAPANAKMWYVVAARPGATISVGIKPKYTQQQFLGALATPELQEILQTFPAEPGDAYYISAGRVHSLSAGVLVLSVEQHPAEPLPVSHFGAPDAPAIPPAQLKEALDAIHFQDRTIARIRCESNPALRNRKLPLVSLCPHFAVDELRLIQAMHDRADGSTFHLLVALDGPVTLSWTGAPVPLARGEACLVPAAMGYYSLAPEGRLTKVLKVTLRT